MIKLLQYAGAQPWDAKFEDTLPVAATDGSLLDRFKNSEAAGRVRAKTGGMDHVNAQIGRASCRERVERSVGAGPVKEKTRGRRGDWLRQSDGRSARKQEQARRRQPEGSQRGSIV